MIKDKTINSFAEGLIDLFNNHKNGLHGIGRVLKPKKELIGDELFNWL